jgi:hypothetical protein
MSMSPSGLIPSGFPPNPAYTPLPSHGYYMPCSSIQLHLINICGIWWTYNTILVYTIIIIIFLYIEAFAFWSIQSYMGKNKKYPG